MSNGFVYSVRRYENNINKQECTRTTEHSWWDKDGNRHAWWNSYVQYFKSLSDAKEHLKQRATARLEVAKRQLEKAQSEYDQVMLEAAGK